MHTAAKILVCLASMSGTAYMGTETETDGLSAGSSEAEYVCMQAA